MTRQSILKAFKNPAPAPACALLGSPKVSSISKRRPIILPKTFLPKLEITSLNQLRKYKKQGLLTSKSSVISSINLQKTGIFEGFSELMEFLYSHNDADQYKLHSLLFKKLANKIQNKGCHSSLCLNFNSSDNFAFYFLSLLKKALLSSKKLKILSVSWRLAESTNDLCMPLFAKILRRLKKINNFSIDFQESDLTYPHLDSFTTALSNLKQLKTISINLCSALPSFSISNQENAPVVYIANALKPLRKIKELDLDLSRNLLISDASLLEISGFLNQMNSLQRLRISLNSTSIISEMALAEFVSSLQRLPALLHLSLGFNRCLKNLKVLDSFCVSVGKLNQLESLNLFCDSWNPSNHHSIQKFSHALGKLTNLNQLVITLNGWTRASRDEFEALGNGIFNLKRLQILALDLSHWSHHVNCLNLKEAGEVLNDNSLMELGQKLGALQNLKELALYVNDIGVVTSKGIAELTKGVTSLRDLQTLIISSEGYDKFEGEDIVSIGKSLLDLAYLEVSMLSLRNTNISRRDLSEFFKVVKPLGTKLTVEAQPHMRTKTRNPKY